MLPERESAAGRPFEPSWAVSLAEGDKLDATRKIALAVGVLFILTFITSIGGVIAYGPVLSDPNYVTLLGIVTLVRLPLSSNAWMPRRRR